MLRCLRLLFCLAPAIALAAPVPLDLSGVKPGPVSIAQQPGLAIVRWQDERQQPWEAQFNLESGRPLIAAIRTKGRIVIQNAAPLYNCQMGKRRGGFDEFFDFPPSHPEGTRSYIGVFEPVSARASTQGGRLEISFDGFRMGSFRGSVRYVFYPGTRLIEQAAVASTSEPDTAYFYDTGLRMAVPRDARPGNNMDSEIAYYGADGQIHTEHPNTSERLPVRVRYRTLAARAEGGSIAVFPSPHKYFMPRDFTTNMGYLWHTSFRGDVSIGIRQLPDDNSRYYPWMNAPPGTEQRMNVFYLVSDGQGLPLLDEVKRYTHGDRFPHVEGFVTVAPHWHVAYTMQAMEKGAGWIPPFKPVLQDMGVDAALIADFHGDGHPQDMTDVRLKELKAYYDYCRAQSGERFLLIPGEEANVHYGGHWILSFPKPVYWFMAPAGAKPSSEERAGYGTVYTIGNAKSLLDMVKREHAFVYETHPRTKGSKGYPDKIRYTEHFLDDSYAGAGWKQMPTDMSSPRMGERSLNLLDDMSNWGLRKLLLSEVDVFQIDNTHELYAHMNVNYVRAGKLPDFDHYGSLLDSMKRGEFFVSTGEVLMPSHAVHEVQPGKLHASAHVQFTFPLAFAELVWGDGRETHRERLDLSSTHPFGEKKIEFDAAAPGWRWARIAVWDVAGDGAFANPVWNPAPKAVVAVDGWHNQEPQPHYDWDATYPGGFSGLAKMLRGLGAETRTIREAITPRNLKGIDCFIVVDPDTEKESPSPKPIAGAEIDALAEWVEKGGTLVLLGNDPGNSEFERMNELARRFGLQFEDRKQADAAGSTKLTLETKPGGWFTPGLLFYGVDIAPLRISAGHSDVLLAERETPILASVESGKGRVIALGDPWLYNEYLYTKDNRQLAEELFRKVLARAAGRASGNR